MASPGLPGLRSAPGTSPTRSRGNSRFRRPSATGRCRSPAKAARRSRGSAPWCRFPPASDAERQGAFIRTLIQVRDPIERAVLVAAPRKGSSDARHVTEHLEELTRLVDTAGAEVVGRISQQITSPNPATLIGEGKV